MISNQYDPISQYLHLKSLLDGTALAVIQNLPLTTANYTIALQKLRHRFGRVAKILQIQLNRLINFKPPTPGYGRKFLTSTEMRQCLDNMQGILQNILQLDDTILTSERIMLELILKFQKTKNLHPSGPKRSLLFNRTGRRIPQQNLFPL